MKKLIEIEVDEFEEGNICYECNMEGCEGYPHDDNRCYVKRWIDEQPTVDAVPVVRCKDCKIWEGNYCNHIIKVENDEFAEYDVNFSNNRNSEWSCADWQRKDGEQDENH